MKFNYMTWEDAARFCKKTFGVYVDWEERFFICPECDEPVYFIDWENHNWERCPVCECIFEEIE